MGFVRNPLSYHGALARGCLMILEPSTREVGLRLLGAAARLQPGRQQRLNLLALPHGQRSLREGMTRAVRLAPDVGRGSDAHAATLSSTQV
jgi:hypothetical protein